MWLRGRHAHDFEGSTGFGSGETCARSTEKEGAAHACVPRADEDRQSPACLPTNTLFETALPARVIATTGQGAAALRDGAAAEPAVWGGAAFPVEGRDYQAVPRGRGTPGCRDAPGARVGGLTWCARRVGSSRPPGGECDGTRVAAALSCGRHTRVKHPAVTHLKRPPLAPPVAPPVAPNSVIRLT
eukprot:366093-Chlamydomonas_euryale.AAC.16